MPRKYKSIERIAYLLNEAGCGTIWGLQVTHPATVNSR